MSGPCICCFLCLEAFPPTATWPDPSSASFLLNCPCARETTPNHPMLLHCSPPCSVLLFFIVQTAAEHTVYLFFVHILSVSHNQITNPLKSGILSPVFTAASPSPRSMPGIEWDLDQHMLLLLPCTRDFTSVLPFSPLNIPQGW